MLIIRLAGGLGNQIFQLGAGLLLAKYNNIKTIIIDDSALDKYEVKRENQLYNFFDLKRLPYKIKSKKFYLNKLRLPKIFPLKVKYYPFISDKNFQFLLNNANKYFSILDGYFQFCLTQENFNEEIKILKKIFINKLTEKKECIIHIRGGDFVKLGWNNITSKDYYIKAMKIMKKNYNIKKFFVITDDKEYAKKILYNSKYNWEFIGGKIEKDFYLIGSFNYRILSSSTFALWASVLGNNDNSFVIAPGYWKPNSYRKIFLPNEIRISNE